jgi:hypothetical protein
LIGDDARPLKERGMSRRDPERERRWRELMSEWERSGQSMRAFCRDRELNEFTFYSWRRELRRRDGEGTTTGRRNRRRRFVQLQVSGPSWLELSLGGELVLRVPSSVSADHLVEILVAAKKATAC